jgi:hypothetical protein
LIIRNVIPDNGGIVGGEEAGKLLLLLRDSVTRLQLHTYLIISNVIPDNGGIVGGEEAGKLLLLLRDTAMRLQLQAHLIISNVIPDNGGIVEGEEAGKLLLGFIILHEALDQELHPQAYDKENLL